MRYCIVTLVKGDIEGYFKSTADLLSAKFEISNLSKRVPCHITFKYPFELDENNLISLENKIASVAQGLQSKEYEVSGLGYFGNSTIYLDIKDEQKIIENFKSTIIALGDFDEDRKYEVEGRKFHISIVRHVEDKFAEVWNYLNAELSDLNFKAKFDNLALLKFDAENNTWKVRKEFPII